MIRYERAEARIDLDAVIYNLALMRENIPQKCHTVAVVKADGYGHGALRIAAELEPLDHIYGFAVATMEEALSLRESGIRKPVMLLGHTFSPQYADGIRNEIRMVVSDMQTAERMAQTARELGRPAQIQIAVDTGMSRIGFAANEESADEIARIARMDHLQIKGMFTHFYASDAADKSAARTQYHAFLRMKQWMEERGVQIPYYHCSNSAAMLDLPELSMDLVRAGIAMYGLMPSDEVRSISLQPVMTLAARVVHVKRIPAGACVSYGGTWTAPEERTIATIGFGYADGYPRMLSNRGSVLIHGKRAPIRGRVCMDQFMADVTDIPGTKAGDEVILIGADGDERITMEELGALSGRFNYELACCITQRVPRVYLHGGRKDRK